MRDNNSPAALARLIRERQPEILDRWMHRVRKLPQLERLPRLLLLDHFPTIIEYFCEELEVDEERPSPLSDQAKRHHANIRFQHGIDIHRVKLEYRILREVVLRLWWEEPRADDGEAVLRFNALLDDALAATFEQYQAAREDAVRARGAEEGTSAQDLVARALERALGAATTAEATAAWLIDSGEPRLVTCGGQQRTPLPQPELFEAVAAAGQPRDVEHEGARYHLLPIMYGQQCSGVVAAWGKELAGEDLHLFEIVAEHLGLVLHLRVLEQKSRTRAENMHQMAEILEQGDPLIVVDREWRISRVNQRQEQLSQMPRSQTLGQNFWELFPDVATDSAIYRRAMNEGKPTFFERYYAPRDMWVDMSVYPIGEGGLAIFFRDVTTRKRAENALATVERRFQLLVDSVHEHGILLLDADGNISSWNPGAERLLGYTAAEVLGQPVSIFYTEEDRAKGAPQQILGQAEREGAAHAEGMRVRKDGTCFWAEVDYGVTRGPDGHVEGYAKIIRDLSERKQREDSLAFLEEAGRSLSQSIEFGETAEQVAALAVPRLADWCVVDYLEEDQKTRALAVAHVDPDKVTWAHELRRQFPPDPNASRGVFHVIRTGEPILVREFSDETLTAAAPNEQYLRIIRKLGMRSAMVLPLIARGRTLGAITLITAESGHRYNEASLVFAQEVAGRLALALDNARLFDTAQRAVRMREDILAIVSHDLRTPLGATQLAADLLSRRLQEDNHTKPINMIKNAVNQMDRLIGDLLDLASIQSGKLRIELHATEALPLIEESIALHQELAQQGGPAVRSCLEIPTGLCVLCDAQRLRQVLGNLLGNAIKFSYANGTVELAASVRDGALRVEVRDDGPGIPPDELPHLFEPYRSGRLHQALGTGLGLYISKAIVEAHGGTIGVDSKPDVGSTFYFTLQIQECSVSD